MNSFLRFWPSDRRAAGKHVPAARRGSLLRVCRGNEFIDFVTVPRSEASDVIVARKCGEQSIPSQDHIIEVWTARRRIAVGELIDQRPGEPEFIVMCGLNSRPRTHRQRGRKTGSSYQRGSATDKHVCRADCQEG